MSHILAENPWRQGSQYENAHHSVVIGYAAVVDQSCAIYPNVTIFGDTIIEEGVTIFSGAVIGRPPMGAGIVPEKFASGPTRIGPGCVIGANAVIYQGAVLSGNNLVGDGATIRENCLIGWESIIGNNSTLQDHVTLGRRVRVVDLSHITAWVVVGDDVFWSVGVISMNDNRDGEGLKPPVVEAGTFIGGGAGLLPGVHIGEKAIVAAGSVVTHDVPSGVRVQGVPARPFFSPGSDPSYDGVQLRPDPDE